MVSSGTGGRGWGRNAVFSAGLTELILDGLDTESRIRYDFGGEDKPLHGIVVAAWVTDTQGAGKGKEGEGGDKKK